MSSDIEMGETGHQSDKDSLISTDISEPLAEYEVEDILAEKRNKNGKTLYLVKWLGYPLHRSDWEPKENLNAEETLSSWNEKKTQIKANKVRPFDVQAFEKDQLRREKETKIRKQARRIKRELRDQRLKRTLFPDDEDTGQTAGDPQIEANSDDSDSLFVAPKNVGLDGPSTKPDGPSSDLDESSSAGSQTETQASPTIPSQPQPSTARIPRSTAQSPSRATSSKATQASQNTTETTGSVNPKKTARKTSTLKKLPLKRTGKTLPRLPLAQPALAGFGDVSMAPIRRPNSRFAIKWSSDRAPDASEINLLKPTEFTPLRNPQVNGSSSNEPRATDQGPPGSSSPCPDESRELSQNKTAASTLHMQLPARPSREETSRPPEAHLFETRPSGYRHRPPLSPSPPPQISAPTDTLHHSSIPPRLPASEVQVSFSQIQTRADSSPTSGHALHHEPSEETQISRMPAGPPERGAHMFSNGHFWNRGELYAHVSYGPAKTSVGPVRICGISSEIKRELIKLKGGSLKLELWFKELCNVEMYAQLCEEAPRNTSFGNAWMEGFTDTNPALFRMAQDLRHQNVMAIFYPRSSRGKVLLAYSRMSSELEFLNWETRHIPNGVPLFLSIRAELPPISHVALIPNPPTGALFSSDPAAAVEEHADNANVQVPTNATQEQENHETPASMPVSQSPEELLRYFFESRLEIKLEDLTTLKDSSKAENFFLHFPMDAQGDLHSQMMQKWLDCNDMTVYSNRVPDGWSRFLNNSKRGVIVFHEDFADFHSLRPPLNRYLMQHTFNFWSARLSPELQWPDPHGEQIGKHFQRLFPSKALILLAEDVFQDRKITAILVYWLFSSLKGKGKGWKIVLPPNAWKRLKEELQQAKSEDETRLLLSTIAWIKRINSTDERSPFFQEESLSPSKIDQQNSNIVSLPITGYGSRSEDDDSAIPKGLSQQERDMDHLAEAFAGWTLTKSACFRRMIMISSVETKSLRDRWRSWGHMTLYTVNEFFRIFKINEQALLEKLKGEQSSRAGHSPLFTLGTPVNLAENPVDAQHGERWKRPSEFRPGAS